MATSIGEYAPVFLPGEHPSLTEKPGRPQSTGLQSQTLPKRPACIDPRLLLPVRALPQWQLSVKEVLGMRGPWQCQVCRDTDCLRCSSYGPIRVFFQASCSWWSEGLFGQSFSLAAPIQALRGLPCLGYFSVVPRIRHIEGAPWLGFHHMEQHIRHLKRHPGWGPTL